MADPEKSQSFWTTIPGMLTGLAAVLTAATGLLVVLHPHSASGAPESKSPATISTPAPAATAPSSVASSPLPAPVASQPAPETSAPAPAAQKSTVVIVDKDDNRTPIILKTLRDSIYGTYMRLNSGQSIPFEKIQSIEFIGLRDSQQALRVTLIDGRSLEGAVPPGEQFSGDTDIGPFSLTVSNMKTVTFNR